MGQVSRGQSGTAQIAANFLTELGAAERSFGWLSRAADIPYSTLYQKVKQKPRSLTVDDVIAVSDAFGVHLLRLVPGPGEAN